MTRTAGTACSGQNRLFAPVVRHFSANFARECHFFGGIEGFNALSVAFIGLFGAFSSVSKAQNTL
jgi:hypothetical protein